MNTMNGNGHPPKLGVNQTYTKFFFVTLHDQPSAGTRIRQVGSAVARGFFNDFDADGQRDLHMFETIQFLLANRTQPCREGLLSATHVAQVSAKYRPRLDEVDAEFRRRLGNLGSVRTLDGAVRTPRYTSAEMDDFAYRRALGRSSGRETPNVIILPMSKTNEWWAMSALKRQTYFYPHTDERSGAPAAGHAVAAEAGVSTIFRRLYHNPDGSQRAKEYDFITYFECEGAHVRMFDEIRCSLRDERQNPEWRYVIEGPEWRGRRVLKW